MSIHILYTACTAYVTDLKLQYKKLKVKSLHENVK